MIKLLLFVALCVLGWQLMRALKGRSGALREGRRGPLERRDVDVVDAEFEELDDDETPTGPSSHGGQAGADR